MRIGKKGEEERGGGKGRWKGEEERGGGKGRRKGEEQREGEGKFVLENAILLYCTCVREPSPLPRPHFLPHLPTTHN